METDNSIDQVGYLRQNKFTMMGGELSINGTLAAAYLIKNTTVINGYPFIKNKNNITVIFPITLIRSVSNNIVKLDGISYYLINKLPSKKTITRAQIKILSELTKESPASGIIYYKDGCIVPLIYVKCTNTYVWERACGSGSLAYAIISGESKVIQPSGEILIININQNISVTANVKEL
jgi:hypothetical protein